MSAPVDVLAVMWRDMQHAEAYRLEHGYADGSLAGAVAESRAARAAIVDLIAEAERCVNLTGGLADLRRAVAACGAWV